MVLYVSFKTQPWKIRQLHFVRLVFVHTMYLSTLYPLRMYDIHSYSNLILRVSGTGLVGSTQALLAPCSLLYCTVLRPGAAVVPVIEKYGSVYM